VRRTSSSLDAAACFGSARLGRLGIEAESGGREGAEGRVNKKRAVHYRKKKKTSGERELASKIARRGKKRVCWIQF